MPSVSTHSSWCINVFRLRYSFWLTTTMASSALLKSVANKSLLSGLRKATNPTAALRCRALSNAAVQTQAQGQEIDRRASNNNQIQRRHRRRPALRRWRDLAPLSDVWDPLPVGRTLSQMMDSVNRIFDEVMQPSRFGEMSDMMIPENFRIPYDVMEDDKTYKIRVDMPGLGKEDVKVGIEDGVLTIRGERNKESKDDTWVSRSYGAYNTRIILPDNVQVDATKAEMNNGVLQVHIPKIEQKEPQNVINVDVN